MCCENGIFFRCVPISLGPFPVINGRGLSYPFLFVHSHPPPFPTRSIGLLEIPLLIGLSYIAAL